MVVNHHSYWNDIGNLIAKRRRRCGLGKEAFVATRDCSAGRETQTTGVCKALLVHDFQIQIDWLSSRS